MKQTIRSAFWAVYSFGKFNITNVFKTISIVWKHLLKVFQGQLHHWRFFGHFGYSL